MRFCLSVVGFALSIAAATAEQLPRPVKAAIAESRTSCRTVRFQPGFIARPDVNGDGRPDYVLDYTFAQCDGDPRGFCGSLGCSAQVFASLPDGTYAKVVDETLRRLRFRKIDGRPAAVLGYAGDAEPCRGDPADVCDVVKIWNGSTFEALDHAGSAPATAQQKTTLAASSGESREASSVGPGLNGATVRVAIYCCTGVGPADLHSNVVAGVAPKVFPEGSLFQTPGPFFIIPVSISINADRIILGYPKGGMFGPAPFNGYHFVFSGASPITSVRLDPASTFRPRGVRFTSNSVDVNVSGQRTGRGAEAIVDIIQGPSPQATAANDASDPSSVVGAVVALDSDGDGKAFGADAFIRRYFTPEFKASWDHAMAQPEDVLDGDPITGAQALKSVKLDAVQVAAKTSDSASVVTKLAVTPRGAETYSQAVTFTLKRDGRGWKIDDISGPVDGSLRGYFRKNYGQ